MSANPQTAAIVDSPARFREIRRTLELLVVPGGIVEVRVLGAPVWKDNRTTLAGYFDDWDRTVEAVLEWDGKAAGIYIGINPPHRDLLAHAANRLIRATPASLTKDADIVSLRFLLLDFDCHRKIKGISATDEERELIGDQFWRCLDWLDERGWPQPIIADSGNGCHALFRIDLPNDASSVQLLKRTLEALAAPFNTEDVRLDTSVFNPSRITKLYGTRACKGDDIPGRPHRYSQLVEVPEPIAIVPRELLEEVAASTPAETQGQKQEPEETSTESPAVKEMIRYLHQHSLRTGNLGRIPNATKIELKPCPFVPAHATSYIFVYDDGGRGFKCFHEGCKDKHWSDLAQLLEPEGDGKQSSSANTHNGTQASASQSINGEEPIAPVLRSEALFGLSGEIVRTILPHTEADSAALLVHFLVGYGSLIGRSAYFHVGSTRHYTNLYGLCVGDTSRGRKGTAWGEIRFLLAESDTNWAKTRIQSGLSSGEGLIAAFQDKAEEKTDKRLLVVQTEFASVLRAIRRDSNTLSPLLRQAWDEGSLHTMVKRDAQHVEGAHLSIIAHVTREELQRGLTETEQANGFINRFLLVRSQRSKCLPEGGRLNPEEIQGLLGKLGSVVMGGKEIGRWDTPMHRDEEGREWWAREYPQLSEGVPGLLGMVTSRSEAQVLRLSMIYALLDSSAVIRVPHLEAAKAVWDYCFDTAKFIFGNATGYPLADSILKALHAAGTAGLSRTQISSALGRNSAANQIASALQFLANKGLAHSRTVGTGVERKEVWNTGPRVAGSTSTA